ncbi:MAG: TAXI family TRAP transporter solute-binding subunit [Alphaproteobacteria bacterium]|nr:TAXI family TRAP transporter solute-binding subunit [Alphaproteobacteria bacterium]
MNKTLIASLAIVALASTAAVADTRVTYKSAKSTSSYYAMAVQLSEAVKGKVDVTVEESQGSVQNVKEAVRRTGNYVFTSPPSLIKLAQGGKKMFEGETGYAVVRSLFPIPSLTMHWVVRQDSGVMSFADLAGKKFIPGGKGSFGQRQTMSTFEALGLAGKVDVVDVELNAAVPAIKNNQVVGFATAGSYPAPNVTEAAASVPIRLLGLSAADLEKVKGDKLVIPAGTYKGVDQDTTTISLPVIAYTTDKMDDEAAYQLTKTYWEGKAAMAKANSWWGGVTPAMLTNLGAKVHPGAARYYAEAGITVPDAFR